jgi:hypothetical protein
MKACVIGRGVATLVKQWTRIIRLHLLMLSARRRVPDEVIGAVSTYMSCGELFVLC